MVAFPSKTLRLRDVSRWRGKGGRRVHLCKTEVPAVSLAKARFRAEAKSVDNINPHIPTAKAVTTFMRTLDQPTLSD